MFSQQPELCIALLALCSETQCHVPPSQSCLGLQVTSCLPVFLSSGTAGAINQPPSFSLALPRALLCPSARADHRHNTTRLAHLACRASRAHPPRRTLLRIHAPFASRPLRQPAPTSVTLHDHLSYDASDGLLRPLHAARAVTGLSPSADGKH